MRLIKAAKRSNTKGSERRLFGANIFTNKPAPKKAALEALMNSQTKSNKIGNRSPEGSVSTNRKNNNTIERQKLKEKNKNKKIKTIKEIHKKVTK